MSPGICRKRLAFYRPASMVSSRLLLVRPGHVVGVHVVDEIVSVVELDPAGLGRRRARLFDLEPRAGLDRGVALAGRGRWLGPGRLVGVRLARRTPYPGPGCARRRRSPRSRADRAVVIAS